MPNQLQHETSPYLLQHADNPVDWHPWGPEAIEKSKRDDKPIFLSIGYSACHWCHVMEEESFENETIAKLLNEHFISIKVDREERPDLDQIYMNAIQLMTGRGGWPMSVFLTSDLRPFFGGTYWPATAKRGMPGFDQVLNAVADIWKQRRAEITDQAAELTERVQSLGPIQGSEDALNQELLFTACDDLANQFDSVHGGFGDAPKFPHPVSLQAVMRAWHRRPTPGLEEMIRLSLDKMAAGGIYDHLAGGFARYSVDERWLVPHFEKMLYDNALLTDAYLDGFVALEDPRYASVARQTLDYVLQYMTDPQGGFYSTEDADSEGEEGKFYVWTWEEIHAVLEPEAAEQFCYVYGVTREGNFEGKNILHLPQSIEQSARQKGWDQVELQRDLASSRDKLLQIRNQRVRPARDDKILTSWNGLMIHTMARAAGILGDDKYARAAGRAADFLLHQMRRDDGRLLHCWRNGQAKFDAYLDDYATLANALISLYETDFKESWIDQAVELAEMISQQFHDAKDGGFFYTSHDHEPLISRNKDVFDDATPSSNAMAATVFMRLGKLCGANGYLEAAEEILHVGSGMMQRMAIGASQLLIALDMFIGPTYEIAILSGQDSDAASRVLAGMRRHYLPNRVVACRQSDNSGSSAHLDKIFAGKSSDETAPAVFICQDFNCHAPRVGEAAAEQAWKTLANPKR